MTMCALKLNLQIVMSELNRALFLDRDGVINHDLGYTSKIESFRFIDGIFELCRIANRQGYLIFVITNQAGIGRGYFSEQDFLELTNWMREKFLVEDVLITDVFYCPYHPQHGLGEYKRDSYDRKPSPGMLIRAAEIYEIDLNASIMIGDKDSDMQAAKSAGIGIRCHYLASDNEISPASTHHINRLSDGILII